jgi:hypothetical protein
MTGALSTDAMRTMRTIAQAARLAPSVHNTQPWRFEITPNSFTLHIDRTRQLRALDPTGRQLMVSVGCALFNIRVAAAAAGRHCFVARCPAGPSADVVARVDTNDDSLTPDELAIAVLEPYLRSRATNRRRFSDDPVSAGLLADLTAAAQSEGARLAEVRDDDDRLTVALLSQRADAVQYQDGAYRAEIRAWTTADPDRLDGVPARAVPHFDTGSGDEIPIRDFDSTGAGWLPTDTRSSRHQCLLLLGADGDHPDVWLKVGEALERIWLEITRAGFAMSPLTQVVEVPSARAALRSELRLSIYPDVLLRIGHAAPTPGSSRRHLQDLLLDPAPTG